jgi:hypothetical protein
VTAPALVDTDTRSWQTRGRWPGRLQGLPIGELWLNRRVDERWDILSADEFVVVSDEARVRLFHLRPPVFSGAWRIGKLVYFSGVRESVTYRVLDHARQHQVWLLRRMG